MHEALVASIIANGMAFAGGVSEPTFGAVVGDEMIANAVSPDTEDQDIEQRPVKNVYSTYETV